MYHVSSATGSASPAFRTLFQSSLAAAASFSNLLRLSQAAAAFTDSLHAFACAYTPTWASLLPEHGCQFQRAHGQSHVFC